MLVIREVTYFLSSLSISTKWCLVRARLIPDSLQPGFKSPLQLFNWDSFTADCLQFMFGMLNCWSDVAKIHRASLERLIY